jgi:hypothetical protein
MEPQKGAVWVVPSRQIPRTFGVLNIIFGAIMLLVGVGYGLFYFWAPTLTNQMKVQFEHLQAKQNADRESDIAKLKAEEAAAKTEAEKQAAKNARAALEITVTPDIDFGDIAGWNVFTDRRLAVYYITEVATGILLNVLMIISGIGLVALAEWARKLALGVAWLKIVRWVGIVVATLVLIIPISSERMQAVFTKMQAQTQAKGGAAAPPIPTTEMAKMTAIFGGVSSIVGAVLAAIYPALVIAFLTRPRARAACLRQEPPSKSAEGRMEFS